MYRWNSDEKIRKLERLVAQGDIEARSKLERERLRTREVPLPPQLWTCDGPWAGECRIRHKSEETALACCNKQALSWSFSNIGRNFWRLPHKIECHSLIWGTSNICNCGAFERARERGEQRRRNPAKCPSCGIFRGDNMIGEPCPWCNEWDAEPKNFFKPYTATMLPMMPEADCACADCRSLCVKPCWPLPDEAEQIIAAGFGHLMMIDYWQQDSLLPRTELLCGAGEGDAGGYASHWPRNCALNTGKHPHFGKCLVHGPFKPIEGRLALGSSHGQDHFPETRYLIAKEWNTPRGRALVQKWKDEYLKDEFRRNPYRKNSDDAYRKIEMQFASEPTIENYAKLIGISRRTGFPTPNPPLSRWQAIVDAWQHSTWDSVVEGGESSQASGSDPEEITPEESQRISSLGYYGKPIEKTHAARLFRDEPYRIVGFAVHYSGIDGTDTTSFKTLEEAANYVNARLLDRLSETIMGDSFSTETGTYELEGFTFNDMEPLELEEDNVLFNLYYHPNGNYWTHPGYLYMYNPYNDDDDDDDDDDDELGGWAVIHIGGELIQDGFEDEFSAKRWVFDNADMLEDDPEYYTVTEVLD